MPYNAGQALIAMVPSFKGVADAIDAEASKWGVSAGSIFAKTFNDRVGEETKNAPLGPSDSDSTQKGSASGGKFADGFKARVEAALRALPDVKIDANSTDADRKIDEIRTRLETLRNAVIGVDITDAEALGAIAVLKAECDELARKSPNIDVKVNGAAASAQLAAIEADASSAGSGLGQLGSDAGASSGDIGVLVPALAALAAALIPIAGLAGGALAGLPGILAGAASGIGALKLGLGGVEGALSAYSTQQTAATKATGGASSAGSSQASQAITNAASIRSAAASVAQATQSLATAQVSADNSVHSAQEQLASTTHQLADAEYSEVQAQQAVIDARQTAQDQLDNYTNSLADSALSIQQAQQDISTAAAGVTATGPGSGATPNQQAQAQLTYQEAVQRLKDLQTQNDQLQTAATAAAQAGVDGNQQVVDAVHNLGDAQQNVSDAQQAQSDAQTALSQAQVSAVQSVTNAQNALTTALQNQQDTLAKIAAGSGGGGGGGGVSGLTGDTNAFNAAMAALTPQGRDFVNFLIGLKAQFHDVGNEVQTVMLPGMQAGLTAMEPLFKSVAGFIVGAGAGIGNFVDKLGIFLSSPPVLAEISTIFQEGAGFMEKMGGAAITFFGAILSAGSQAGPIVSVIGTGIVNLVNAFANWVEDGGFQKFMKWLQDNGPSIVSDISGFIKGIGSFIVAVTPAGKVLDDVVGAIGRFISSISGVIKIVAELITFQLKLWIWYIGEITKGVDYLSSHWKQLWADIKQWADDGFQHVKSAVFDPLADFFTHTIPSLFDKVVGFFTALPGRIVTGLGDLVGTIFGGLEAVGSWLETNAWGNIQSWFVAIPTRIGTVIGDFFTTAFDALTKAGSWLETNAWANIQNWFVAVPTRIGVAIGDFFSTAFADLTTAGGWLESHVWQPISSFFSGLGKRIADVAVGMWDGIANAFISAINAVINVWDGLHFTIGGGSFAGITFPSFTLGTPHINDIGLLGASSLSTAGAAAAAGFGGGNFRTLAPTTLTTLANLAGPAPAALQPVDLSGVTAAAHVRTGPVQHVDKQIINSQADAEGMSQALAFLASQQRL